MKALYKKLVFKVFKKLTTGKLIMTLPGGEKKEFGNDAKPVVDMQILSDDFFKQVVLQGDIGFGEAYMHKLWQSSDLYALLNWFLLNKDNISSFAGSKGKLFMNFLRPMNSVKRLLRKSSIRNAPQNIEEHYDVSNDFFKLILDPSLTYSSAFFNEKSNISLKKAQEMKYKRICDIAGVKKGDHVLEIGGGWAGFSIYASKHYGCRVSSITISPNQHALGNQRIKKAKLQKKVDYKILDYRYIKGKFDKIVSIEMIEAVGWEYLSSFFKICEKALKPGGVLALQAIICPDNRYDYMKRNPNFIQKYIFPGSFLPSIRAMLSAISDKHELFLYDMKDMGKDYVRTLDIWAKNLKLKQKEIKKLGFDDAFIRKWEYYFRFCQAGFYNRHISVGQLVFSRPNEFIK